MIALQVYAAKYFNGWKSSISNTLKKLDHIATSYHCTADEFVNQLDSQA
jgi:hypothetical protein